MPPFNPNNTDTAYHPALEARPSPVPLRVPDGYFDTPRRDPAESLIDCPNDDSHTMVAGSVCHCGARDYSTTT